MKYARSSTVQLFQIRLQTVTIVRKFVMHTCVRVFVRAGFFLDRGNMHQQIIPNQVLNGWSLCFKKNIHRFGWDKIIDKRDHGRHKIMSWMFVDMFVFANQNRIDTFICMFSIWTDLFVGLNKIWPITNGNFSRTSFYCLLFSVVF